METHCQMLLYLDKRNFLNKIKIECVSFLRELSENPIQKFIPFRYLFNIDVMNLLDDFPQLAKLLIEEPMAWQRIASEVLYACIQSLITDSDQRVDVAQVVAVLRLSAVPKLLVHPNQCRFAGLVSFTGILMSISKPTNYVYHTVWSCPEECEGNEVILQYSPKVPPKCSICRSVLFENSGMRRCGEKVIATINFYNYCLPKTFPIVDDLITKLKLGFQFKITGVVIKKIILIWSVEPTKTLSAPLAMPIPNDIKKLFEACNNLSWKFIYCLASSIGINICPLHCFMTLKMSLLLSLASVKANIATGSPIIHVLTAGLDTSYVGNVMSEAAKLAERKVFAGTLNKSATSALLASTGGVLVMPLPLYNYKQKLISETLSAIESNEILTDTGKVKLQSAVWAQGMNFEKIVMSNIASVLGFVCRGDYGEYSNDIVEFNLQNAVERLEVSKEETKALKDISKYLDMVGGLNVSLDRAAERLLRSYFLTARKECPRGVTVGTMGALVAISLTSARLCRRSVASVEDSVFAIWLHANGCQEPRFTPQEYLQTPADVKKFQSIMLNFKEWLEQFIGSAINLT